MFRYTDAAVPAVRLAVLAVAAILLFLAPGLFEASGAAHAHGLRISAAPSAGGIAGRVFYSDEAAAVGERIRLNGADGRLLTETRSDSDGRFTFELSEAGTYRLSADGEDGHYAEMQIEYRRPAVPVTASVATQASKASQVSSAASGVSSEASRVSNEASGVSSTGSGVSSAMSMPEASSASSASTAEGPQLAAIVRNELLPLREDLARFEQRVRLGDLVGGLGLIAGLAGAAIAWRTRRALARERADRQAADRTLKGEER